MSVQTTISALQTKHATITGMKSAPTAMPSVLNTADLPMALVWPADAEWSLQAMGLRRQDRLYIVRVFVAPVAQDRPVDGGYQRCLPLIEAFGQAYQADTTLGGAVDHINDCRDMGISGGGYELTWGGMPYWGFVYRVQVTEKAS
jgi:hypothetical protein